MSASAAWGLSTPAIFGHIRLQEKLDTLQPEDGPTSISGLRSGFVASPEIRKPATAAFALIGENLPNEWYLPKPSIRIAKLDPHGRGIPEKLLYGSYPFTTGEMGQRYGYCPKVQKTPSAQKLLWLRDEDDFVLRLELHVLPSSALG